VTLRVVEKAKYAKRLLLAGGALLVGVVAVLLATNQTPTSDIEATQTVATEPGVDGSPAASSFEQTET